MVDVRSVYAHAVSLIVQAHLCSAFCKRTVPVVLEELIDLVAIMGHIQVDITIVVRIVKQGAHSNSCIDGSRGKSNVLKSIPACISEHGVVAVDVDDVQVEPAILVKIRRVQTAAWPFIASIPICCSILKRAISPVDVQPVGLQVISGYQVEPTVVIEVTPKCCIRRAIIVDACRNAHLFKLHTSLVSK